jgi:hypothetical protein
LPLFGVDFKIAVDVSRRGPSPRPAKAADPRGAETEREERVMTKGLRAAVIAGLWLTTACGKRVPGPPAGAVAGVPRVGWVIMMGDADDPDREFVCQSEPRSVCVIPGRPAQQRFADVHFYFHAGAVDTTYSGKILIGFFGSDQSKPHEFMATLTVKQDDKVGNASVTGIVPSQPGTRDLTIDVLADAGGTLRIQDRISVEVQ